MGFWKLCVGRTGKKNRIPVKMCSESDSNSKTFRLAYSKIRHNFFCENTILGNIILQ